MFSQKQKYLALIILSIILTASITTIVTRAVTTAPSTLTISSGVYPGAPTYTVWKESSVYYAKDANGLTVNSSTYFGSMINLLFFGPNICVFVKGGTYTVNTPIFIPYSNCSLYGEGISTCFVAMSGLDDDVIQLSGTGTKDIHLSNFAIDGNKAANSAGSGIHISTTYVYWDACFMIDHLHIKECAEDGITIEGDTRVVYLSNLNIQMCDDNGIYLAGTDHFLSQIEIGWSGLSGIQMLATSTKLNNVKVFAAGQEGSGIVNDKAGFYLNGPDAAVYCTFTDCTAEDCRYNGWLLDEVRHDSFSSCWAKNCGTGATGWDGWNMTNGCYYLSWAASFVYDSGTGTFDMNRGFGMYGGCYELSFAGCWVVGCDDTGLYLGDSDYCSIAGGFYSNNGDWGIQEAAGSTYNIVSSVHSRTDTTGGIYIDDATSYCVTSYNGTTWVASATG